jgi:hypothetical protein
MSERMFCPECGTQASPDRRFCRSCGIDLQAISNFLTGRLETYAPVDAQTASIEPARNERRKMLGQGFAVFWGGAVLAVLFGIIGGSMSSFDHELGNFIQDLSGLGALVMMIGVGFMIYSRFLPHTGESRKPPQAKPLPQTPPPLSFEPERRTPVSSVTENTTNLLDRDDPRTRAQKPARQRE